MKSQIARLEGLLNDAADGLSSVTGKKMFGCHALWAKENVFALVWKKGQIGVKLPDESDYSTAMALKGAAPWKAGPMTMSHWVLLPEGAPLKSWVKRAHALALAAPPKAGAKKKTAAVKKKKPGAK